MAAAPALPNNSDLFRSAEWSLVAADARPAGIDVDAALAGLETARDGVTRDRLASLKGARSTGGSGAAAYVDRWGLAGIYTHRTSGGTRLWQMRVETYPGHVNNLYLIEGPRGFMLWDAGSNQASSLRDTERGFAAVRGFWRVEARIEDVKAIVVSHGHVDHFSGAPDLGDRTHAPVYIHRDDLAVLSDPRGRYDTHLAALIRFLDASGMPAEIRKELLPMYSATKDLCRPAARAAALAGGDRIGEEVGASWVVTHVPGHCPGHLCLRIDDMLLTGDHVLARITPHQGPGFLTAGCGLAHYFASLDRVKAMSGIRRALPGHQEPIENLGARIDEIRAHHEERFTRLVAMGRSDPATSWEYTDRLYQGRLRGYNRLLGVLETAAHLEWLEGQGVFRREGDRTRVV